MLNRTNMKNYIIYIILPFAAAGAVAMFSVTIVPTQALEGPVERKIVTFKDAATDEKLQDKVLNNNGAHKLSKLGLVNGASILADQAAQAALETDANVKSVIDDVVVTLEPDPGETVETDDKPELPPGQEKKIPVGQPDQILDWYIDRIKTDLAWEENTGKNIKIGILDTGIDMDHSDLEVKQGVDCIQGPNCQQGGTGEDDHGHGTRMAGIAAARNNTIGAVGVAPEAHLYSIKVIGSNGSGWLSDIFEGLEWAVQHQISVVNMSFSTSVNVPEFEEVTDRVFEAGVVQVAAAGNWNGPVHYPAAYDGVIAVSSTDKNDNRPGWSNYGPEINIAAPGVVVYSTNIGDSYRLSGGTSVSAPQVTGAAALVLRSKIGEYDVNNKHKWDPAEVQTKLEATATDIGDPGRDDFFGYGLLNAFEASK